jgi:membrane-bound lytic murein transglycosylase A
MDAPNAPADFSAFGVIEPDPVPFDRIAGLRGDDLVDAWTSFRLSCDRIVHGDPGIRPGVPPGEALIAVCADALNVEPASREAILAFMTARFRAYRVRPDVGAARGFLTGYYEPIIEGSWTKSADFNEPLLARPADLVTLRPGDNWGDLDKRLAGGKRAPGGALKPYDTRAEIDGAPERYRPLVWVRDAIEAFMIQVQGSATIRVGSELVRMTYAGRNGRPYTSIGRILIERGEIAQADMALAVLKQWVRDHGQAPGDAGRALLWQNESFVFFEIDRTPARQIGPIGAAGTPLRPLRSIAVDRSIWPYGLPFWIEADLPWQRPSALPFKRLMIAQDTGSAIIGRARADLYIGAGAEAGAIAGDIRHPADFIVFLPVERRP